MLLSTASHSLPAEAAVLALLGKLLILLVCMSVKLLRTVVLENIPSETLTSQFKFSALTCFAICQARSSRAFWGSLHHSSLWLFIARLAQVTVGFRLDHSVVHCCFQAKENSLSLHFSSLWVEVVDDFIF